MTIFRYTDTCIAVLENVCLGKQADFAQFQQESVANRFLHLRFCKGRLRYLYLYSKILSLKPEFRKSSWQSPSGCLHGRRHVRGVRRRARGPHRALQRGSDKAIAGPEEPGTVQEEPDAVQEEPGFSRLGGPGKRPHPPSICSRSCSIEVRSRVLARSKRHPLFNCFIAVRLMIIYG